MVRHRMGTHVPGWFHEGTAEYYAMMRRTDGGVEAGLLDPVRLRRLKTDFWLPVSYMIATETPASLPTADAMHKFYAQASVYIHLLHLSPTYQGGLPQFIQLIAEGVSSEEGLGRVYSKSAAQFDSDARDWLRRNKLPAERLKAPPEGNWAVKTRKIAPIEEQLARATVACTGPGRAQARSEYARLSRMAGDDCVYQAPLGDLAYAGGLASEAAGRYQEAERCGVKVTASIEALEESKVLRGGSRVESGRTQTGRTEATRRDDPDHDHFLQGTGRFFENDFAGAVREFKQITRLPQADQFRMTRLRALALLKLARFDDAEREAGKLRTLAVDAEQQQTAQLTLDDVQRARRAAEPPLNNNGRGRPLPRLPGRPTKTP
jgi:hypothetical protein